MPTFTYEGVSFYVENVSQMSEADFVKHEKHHGLKPEQLREAYKLIKAQVKQAKKADIPLEIAPSAKLTDEGDVVPIDEKKTPGEEVQS